MINDIYYVVVRSYEFDHEVKRLGGMGLQKAQKVEAGININLGDDYYTEIVTESGVSDE